MKIDEIPVPVGAQKGVADISYKTSATTAANVRLIDVKERFGEYDSEIYTLSETTDWRKIGEFFDRELARHNFVRKTNVPSAPIDSDIIYYEQINAADKKIAVALLEAVNGENAAPRQFLLIAVSK